MKAAFSARAWAGTKMRPRPVVKPNVYKLFWCRAGIGEQQIYGLVDYSKKRVEVWYTVRDGFYRIEEPYRNEWSTRYVHVSMGMVTDVNASEIVQCLRQC
jgi:hypothetical protein